MNTDAGWLSQNLPLIVTAGLYLVVAWIIIHGIRRDNRDK